MGSHVPIGRGSPLCSGLGARTLLEGAPEPDEGGLGVGGHVFLSGVAGPLI
jgi:hypothetical protein